MRDRMPPEMLARAKGQAATANQTGALARKANGHGVSRADAKKARQELVEAFGERKADQLQEQAMRRAGAAPKTLFGRLRG